MQTVVKLSSDLSGQDSAVLQLEAECLWWGCSLQGTGLAAPKSTPQVTFLWNMVWPLGSLTTGFPFQSGVINRRDMGVDQRMGTRKSDHLIMLLKMALWPNEDGAFQKSHITSDNSDSTERGRAWRVEGKQCHDGDASWQGVFPAVLSRNVCFWGWHSRVLLHKLTVSPCVKSPMYWWSQSSLRFLLPPKGKGLSLAGPTPRAILDSGGTRYRLNERKVKKLERLSQLW